MQLEATAHSLKYSKSIARQSHDKVNVNAVQNCIFCCWFVVLHHLHEIQIMFSFQRPKIHFPVKEWIPEVAVRMRETKGEIWCCCNIQSHGSFLICIYYNTWDKTWVRVRHSPLCEVWKWTKKRDEFELMYQVLKDKCIIISEEVHHPPSPDFMPISYAVNRSRADSWRGLSQTSKYVNSVTRVPVKMWRVKR